MILENLWHRLSANRFGAMPTSDDFTWAGWKGRWLCQLDPEVKDMQDAGMPPTKEMKARFAEYLMRSAARGIELHLETHDK